MPQFGPAADQDAREAYLFLCLGNGHYAVTCDRSGSNLPRASCLEGWKFVREFPLGVREPLPIDGDPEPVLRSLRDTGYYIWPSGLLPHGTSQ
jgi:hypothetical protein